MVQTPKAAAHGAVSKRGVGDTSKGHLSERAASVLLGSAPDLGTPAEQRRARILAAINLVLCGPLLVGAIQLGALDRQAFASLEAWLLAAGALVAAGGYALSRTQRLRIATGLTIALLWAVPTAYLGLEAQRGAAVPVWTAAWLAIPILLAGTLARPTTIVVAASGAILVPAVTAPSALVPAAIAPCAFLACVGGITFLLACHRENVERDRVAQLVARKEARRALPDLAGSSESAPVAESQVRRKPAAACANDTVLPRRAPASDDTERALSDERRALLRSESLAAATRGTAGAVDETRAPLAAVLAALSDARAFADEYAHALDYPDTTDEDHRALAEKLSRSLDRATRAAQRSAALLQNADLDIDAARGTQSEIRRTA